MALKPISEFTQNPNNQTPDTQDTAGNVTTMQTEQHTAPTSQEAGLLATAIQQTDADGPDTTTQKVKAAEDKVKAAEDEEYPSYTLTELLAMQIKEIPCLFKPIFPRGELAVIIGGSAVGKSTLLRQMCLHVAEKRNFLGWEYNGVYGHAIYFSSEDGKEITAKVSQDYNATFHSPKEATDNVRYYFGINPDNIAEKLVKALEAEPSDLVIIDAFGDAFNGKNLNDNTEVRKFYAPFKKIAEIYDCLIIFNHHTGKRTNQFAPGKDNAIGSQAIEGKVRLVIELREDPEDDEIIHLCIVKSNLLKKELTRDSYALGMNEHHVFYATGDRRPQPELVPSKNVDKGKLPRHHKDIEHIAFLKTITDGINQKALKDRIGDEFEIRSEKYQKQWVEYYIEKGWLKSESGPRNSIIYSKLIK